MGANKESQQQDNFFKIPTELKDKLKENPEILQLIETTGKDWQANWTKKRQDEAKEVQQIRDQVSGMESYKQKAEAMDRLLSKASFTEYLVMRIGLKRDWRHWVVIKPINPYNRMTHLPSTKMLVQ